MGKKSVGGHSFLPYYREKDCRNTQFSYYKGKKSVGVHSFLIISGIRV